MSHELLYTSAQHGLKPGSYGFCTVMSTDGLSKALQDRLESLSGYEHAFAVTDKRVRLNPVNYSHLIVTVANQRSHLLSRVADAGADYSGRSNKLAHHVVLQPSELTAASPASTLATSGFCKTGFDGTPRSLPQGVLPTTSPRPLAICSAWESVCQDAGWAGVLAEQTLQNPSRPITLIYAPGCDVLPLVVEAMSLLPADRQWRTTFSTFFTKLPAGVECQWRFVLDGTPAADQARRNLQSPPIDLTSPTPVTSNGPLVEAARTGKMPEAVLQAATAPTAKSSPSGSKSAAPGLASARGTSTEDSSDTYRLASTISRPPRAGAPPVDDLFSKRGPSPVFLASAIGGSLAVLVVGIVLGVFLMGGSKLSPPEQHVAIPQGPAEVIEKPKSLVHAEPIKTSTIVYKTIEPPKVALNPKPVEVAADKGQPKEKSLGFDEITKDITSKGSVLSLPKREQGLSSLGGEHELCKIFVKKPTDCELKLVTTEAMDDGQPRLFLTRDAVPAEGTQSWTAVTRAKNTTLQSIEEMPIGRFTLKDQSLIFEWKQAPDWTSPFGLLYCKLDINVGSEKIQCSLTKPTIKVADRLDLAHRKATMPADISAGTLSSVKFLRYDIEVRLGDIVESKSGIKAEDDQFLKFELPADGDAGDTRVDLELRFLAPTDKRDAAFAYRAFVFPSFLKPQQQGLGWEHVTQRNDLVDEVSKEGFTIPDLDRYRKKTVDERKKSAVQAGIAKKELSGLETAMKATDMELDQAVKNGKDKQAERLRDERNALNGNISQQKNVVRHWQQAVDQGEVSLKWLDTIKRRFEAIQSKLDVRFTVYLEFLSDSKVEQVVLVETNPPPSNRQGKSTKSRSAVD